MEAIHIVTYDISNTKTRTKISKILSDYGIRVQYSVFECEMNLSRLQQLVVTLKNVFDNYKIDEDFDNIRIYTLCESCLKRRKIIGLKKQENNNYYLT